MSFLGASQAVVLSSASQAEGEGGCLGACLCWLQKLAWGLFKAALPLRIVVVQLLYLIFESAAINLQSSRYTC